MSKPKLDWERIDAMLREGKRTHEICTIMGCVHSSVSHRRRKLGLPVPKQDFHESEPAHQNYAKWLENEFRKIHAKKYPHVPYEQFREKINQEARRG